MREKPGLLNDIADAAPEPDGIPFVGRPVANDDLTGGGNEQTIDKLQQGGFAAAAATEENQSLAGIDGKMNVTNNRVTDGTVNAVCYILKLNGRVGVQVH